MISCSIHFKVLVPFTELRFWIGSQDHDWQFLYVYITHIVFIEIELVALITCVF